MNGAAIAGLIAQAVYFSLIILTIRLTLGCRIFTRRHLLTIVLLLLVFAANALLLRYLPLTNVWLSSLVRSLLLVPAAWAAYRWQLSPELNNYITSCKRPF